MHINRAILFKRLIIVILTVLSVCLPGNAGEKILSGGEIKPLLRIYDGIIISGSDSLVLNGTRLARDSDYRIDYLRGMIYLSRPASAVSDTLRIFFTPLPSWLRNRYGVALETTRDRQGMVNTGEIAPMTATLSRSEPGILIKGAKRFSILSRTGGASQFNQSLELTIRGELASGVEILGSVTDRGYDPAYGAINSRISELDKLYLAIRSRRFSSEIGNLELVTGTDYERPVLKQVSGITSAYTGEILSFATTIARPRGTFTTVRLAGIDRMQGPYRVVDGDRIKAMVPGSERVWVDGRLLDRGADKDYIADYPGAAVTFTPRVPIDSRSRIEIDYEPLSADYQRELYRLAGGATTRDSTVTMQIGYLREGDVRDEPKAGELGAEDIALLAAVGDTVSQSIRDGAVADSTGDYVERFDVPGQRYFEYVGNGMGDYRVAFTPVGPGKGDYVYEGGNRYRYVGKNMGDYLPIVPIPVPAREEYFDAGLTFR
ncbi:MAG: hypothetical protein JSV44_03640, partial [Candidatus Zixiibacteriota bacterium]